MTMDAENLLYRLNSGEEIDEEELDEVVDELRRVMDTPGTAGIVLDDTYAFLQVLGRSKRMEHMALLERFLEVEDALTVSLVLETICLEWEQTEEHLEQVINFALGVNWDDDGDVRETAITILGEFLAGALAKDRKKGALRTERLSEVLKFLLSLLEDPGVEDSVRQGAYRALCRAGGMSLEEIPSQYSRLDLTVGSPDRNEELLLKLRQLSESSVGSSRDKSASESSSGTSTGIL